MRSIWKGSISFGLVNIPVNLYSAASERELSFDFLHKTDFSPVRYAKVCEREEKEITYHDLIKGYEYESGKYVALTEEDFKKVAVARSKNLEITSFADEASIDTKYFDKPYYLEPDKNAEKAYSLLYNALKHTKKVGISKLVLRQREHLCIIKAGQDALILNQLRFAHDVRSAEDLKVSTNSVTSDEVKMAEALVQQLTKPFNIEDYKDTYTDALKKMIKYKAAGKTIEVEEAPTPQASKTEDLMALLQKSITAQS